MIVLDLEWNYGEKGNKLMEVLQIGAVRIKQLGGVIEDTFDCYIRPQVHDELNYGAKQLPELAQYLESDLCFPDAMEAFRAWCGEDNLFATWGAGDVEILNQNCAYWNIPAVACSVVYDFQMAFSNVLGIDGKQIALYRAAAYCKIPDTFTFHNALNDAMYTAMLSKWLNEASLAYGMSQESRQGAIPQRELPSKRTAECPMEAQVLHHRTARNMRCPVCREKIWVQEWYQGGEHLYYSKVTCTCHSRFLYQLTLMPCLEEQWCGVLETLVITKELGDMYRELKKGMPIVCITKRAARRKRRKNIKRTDRGA